MSVIVGIHYGHDSTMSIVKDGKLVANISSERIKGVKKYDGIDDEIANYVLSQAKLSPKDVDSVVVTNYWPDDKALEVFKFLDLDKYSIDEINNGNMLGNNLRKFEGWFLGKEVESYLAEHHIGHAGSAYYFSNFDNAIVMTIDACSGVEHTMNGVIGIGNGNSLDFVDFPNNMSAIAYNTFTSLLELGPPLHKAGTTMGLASYGKVHPKVIKNIKDYVAMTQSSGNIHEVFEDVWKDLTGMTPRISWTRLNEPEAYENNSKIKMYNTQEGRDMAATIQYIFEQSILDTVEKKLVPYKIENLALAGGSFLNCNVNSLIKSKGWFKNIYNVPAQGDDGLAAGSAFYIAHHVYNEPRKRHTNREVAYTGKEYKVSKLLNHKKVAKFIADGKIVAWANGASEFGPRALGHRSLLADPRNFHNREILNFIVKGREWFRPFAPSVLEEEAHKWFSPGDPSPFMLYTQKVLQPEKVPAITHIDGTARIQTVSKDIDEDYYKVIKEFFKLTGIPMVVNTSLNGKGQPIIETEEQALDLFNQNPAIDVLVLHGKIYEK